MMKKVQQDVMCVLLQTLLDKELITQDIHDKSREKILDTLVYIGSKSARYFIIE